MGQYFKPVIINKETKNPEAWLLAHNYDNGLKLMEHSYIGNTFMQAVEKTLLNNPQHLVWAGDYADPEEGNLYSQCGEDTEIKPEEPKDKKLWDIAYPYIINHTKKQYISKESLKKPYRWLIHPLSLLTMEDCNGRGGGDFQGSDVRLGIWSGDQIEISDKEPEGYEEIGGYFVEE
jgi:hypothetical protein